MQERLQQACRNVVQNTPDLRGVFVSDARAHTVARSIRALQSKRQVAVVGYDLVVEHERLLGAGGIDFRISQRSEMQGYQGICAPYRHIGLDERVPRRIMVPLDSLTKEDLQYYRD